MGKSSAKKRRERSIMTRSNSSRGKRERARLSPFRNMPNNGNRGGVMQRGCNRNRRQQIALEMREKQRAQAEVDRLLQTDNDMFEKYLKKPAGSSVGFLMLSQQREQRRDKSSSPVFSNENETLGSDCGRRGAASRQPARSFASRGHIRIQPHSNQSPQSYGHDQHGRKTGGCLAVQRQKYQPRHASHQEFSRGRTGLPKRRQVVVASNGATNSGSVVRDASLGHGEITVDSQ